MLARNSYSQEFIAHCRTRIGSDVQAYRKLAAASGQSSASALEAIEPVYFNNLLLAMDAFFTHRTRTLEKKDGNPLNEVRVLCRSIVENDAVLMKDSTINLNPAKSVLGLAVGDSIRLSLEEFVRISDAYFAEMLVKFAE
ncbi:MAG: hypothetical protein Q7K25_10970 [Actinomycetota bacterium]|nr:hypothetical protein [Actinomycetota bacterium]